MVLDFLSVLLFHTSQHIMFSPARAEAVIRQREPVKLP
jgi:hypothetical protein